MTKTENPYGDGKAAEKIAKNFAGEVVVEKTRAKYC